MKHYNIIIKSSILLLLLLLPNLCTIFFSIDLNYSFVKQVGYLLMVLTILVMPALFLKTRAYFVLLGIANFVFYPIELASLYLNRQSATPLFLHTILNTNQQEANELMQSFWWILIIVVCTWGIYIYISVTIPNVPIFNRQWKIRIGSMCMLVVGAIYASIFVLVYHTYSEGSSMSLIELTNDRFNQKFRKIFPCNIYIGGYEWYQSQKEWKISQDALNAFNFGINQRDSLPSELYILYIGESARYDHFSINGYSRTTSPYLDTCSNLISFKQIYSRANLTALSVPYILTRATPDNPSILHKEKSLVEAFHEAGFYTGYINKNASSSFVIRIMQTCAYQHLYASGIDGQIYDTEMLTDLKKNMSEHAWMFVLHGLGSHFKYSLRYPEEEVYFLPAMTAEDGYNTSKENKERMVNAYDNSILFTAKALGELIEWVKTLNRPAIVLYLSDHGESLWDDERNLALHGSYELSEAEYHIPFFIWYSDEYAQRYPGKITMLKQNQYKAQTSSITFSTMLDLADIHEIIDSSLSACSPHMESIDTFSVKNGRNETVPFIISQQYQQYHK